MEAAGQAHFLSEMVDRLELEWSHTFPPGYTHVRALCVQLCGAELSVWCSSVGGTPFHPVIHTCVPCVWFLGRCVVEAAPETCLQRLRCMGASGSCIWGLCNGFSLQQQ